MARHIDVVQIGHDRKTGGLDLAALKAKISARTAAVYFESPGYLGGIEAEGGDNRRSHGAGGMAPRPSSAPIRFRSAC